MTQPDPCAEPIALECARIADELEAMGIARQTSAPNKGEFLKGVGIVEASEYLRSVHPIEES